MPSEIRYGPFDENEAGKTALVKIMTGSNTDYSGEYHLFGQQVHFENINEAQKLNMINNVTAAQNIFIGRKSDGFFCNDRIIKRFCVSSPRNKPREVFRNFVGSFRATFAQTLKYRLQALKTLV